MPMKKNNTIMSDQVLALRQRLAQSSNNGSMLGKATNGI